jgi:hypothetical protein
MLAAGFYKYVGPYGTRSANSSPLLFSQVAIVNMRVHGSVLIPSNEPSPQQQMQMPEGLDYSKFQHSNANHARLPCLLCHRRDSNAPMPTRPGADKHLPCAGCHAQQFRECRQSALWDLSHRRKVRCDETLSAPQKFQYEVRSRAPHGQRELRWLSSSRARRRSAVNSFRL